MITIIPRDAIKECLHAFGVSPSDEGDWWLAYQWVCERFVAWPHKGRRYTILDGRHHQSCYGSEFEPLRSRDEPVERLGILFAHLGLNWIEREKRKPQPGLAERFLASCKIRKWADLDKPIRLYDQRPEHFPDPDWFEMRGRRFIKSPNEYHPRAVWIQGFDVKLVERTGWCQWVGRICYGYPHDSSSWYVGIPQFRGEPLDKFGGRIQKTIDDLLVPESWDHGRKCDNADWDRKRRAIRCLFFVDMSKDEDKLVSRMMKDRLNLSPARLATVNRWLGADARKRRNEERKRERRTP